MKQNFTISRYTIIWVVFLCYLLPLVSLSVFNNVTDSWNVLSIGLFLTAIGSLIIFGLLIKWESQSKGTSKSFHDAADETGVEETETTQQSSNAEHEAKIALANEKLAQLTKELEEGQHVISQLSAEIETLTAQIQQSNLDKEQTLQQVQASLTEWEDYRQKTYKQMEQQQGHIQQLQGTIADQKAILEKKQQLTGLLETKVGDLTYEIKTLLQLAEAHSGSIYNEPQPPASGFLPDYPQEEFSPSPPEKQIRTSAEASLQLKRCLDIAQKITGSHRFNNQFSSFLDSPADGFTLDLRRLCDTLRSENSSTILLYSPKENQLLFANNQIRNLTGWSPDKFIQNFTDLIQDEASWRQGILSLTMRSEAQIQFSLKTKSGHDIIVQGHLGMIPTGIFRQHAIAVLYVSSKL